MKTTPIYYSLPLVALGLLATSCGKKPSQTGPDLAFSGAPVLTPAAPTTAQTTNVAFTMINSGNVDAGSFSWKAYIEDDAVATGTVASLAQGATQAASFMLPAMEPVAHAISIVIDPTSAIQDRNRGNNEAAFNLTPTVDPTTPAPYDLNFSVPPSASPASPTTATPVTISFTVFNNTTTGTTASNVHWHIFDNGQLLGNNTILSIAPNMGVAQSFGPLTLTAGSHTFTVEIDPNGVHYETNDTDASNVGTVVVAVGAAG